MTIASLKEEILSKQSFLCIGLDTDLDKIPNHLLKEEDPIFAFNKAIIDATHELCVSYKPNTAFYEAYGVTGWKSLEKTIAYIRKNHPKHLVIADAKRGDIGNTATRYAKAFFEDLDCQALTVAPYMGKDSVEPFLAFENRFTVLLALTSNPGAYDFQTQRLKNGGQVFEEVIKTSQDYNNSHRLMYVVGATKTDYIASIRKAAPEAFFLVPGVGAQGGDLAEVCKHGLNSNVGLLINSSRGIIYASTEENFAEAARSKAKELQIQMAQILDDANQFN